MPRPLTPHEDPRHEGRVRGGRAAARRLDANQRRERAKRGGLATAKKMSAAERRDRARHAAKVRWSKS